MPRDAVSRTANVERTGRHKWVNMELIKRLVRISPPARLHYASSFALHKTVRLGMIARYITEKSY